MIKKRYCSIFLGCYLSLWCEGQIAFSRTNFSSMDLSYHDDRIRVAIPAKWSSMPVFRTSDGSRFSKEKIGEVFSNGLFDFYLLTHYNQASGIKGGRFGEVAAYIAPWLNSDEPDSCLNIFKQEITRISKDLVRVDLILDPKLEIQSGNSSCLAVQRKVSHRVWAGAYFGYLPPGDNRLPGFFINLPLGINSSAGSNQMVLAASVPTISSGTLPAEGDPRLRLFLVEIDRVISGMKYKKSE